MSAIIEIKVDVARTEEIVRIIWDVEKRINTQVVIGVGVRACDERWRGEYRPADPQEAEVMTRSAPRPISVSATKVIRDLTNAAPISADNGAAAKEMVNAHDQYPCTATARPRKTSSTITSSFRCRAREQGGGPERRRAGGPEALRMQIAAEYKQPASPGRRPAWRLAARPTRGKSSTSVTGASATSRTSRRFWPA